MGTKTVIVDGRELQVPDDATPEEIDALAGGPPAPRSYAASEVPAAAAKSALGAPGRVAAGVVHSAAHPIDTIKSLLSVAGLPLTVPAWAAASGVEDLTGIPTGQDFRKEYMQPALDYGKNLWDTYGSWDKIKRTLAETPERPLMDALSFTPPGKVTAPISKAATAAAATKAGAAAVKAGDATLDFMKGMPANVVDLLVQSHEGIGPSAVKDVYEAGTQGKKAVREAISKGLDYGDVVQKLHNAFDKLVENKGQTYNTLMSTFKGADQPVDFSKVDQAIQNANEMGLYRGKSGTAAPRDLRSPEEIQAHNLINEKINAWKQLDPAEFHTAYGFDKMKQEIQKFVDTLSDDNAMKTPAQAYAGKIMSAIRSTIRDVAPPEYVEAMDKYGKQMDQLRDFKKEFKLGDRNTNLQTVRSMQQVYRRTAGVAHEEKENLLRTALDNAGDKDLMQMIAGSQFKPVMPQGMRGTFVPLITSGVASGALGPGALAIAGLSSPRLTGVTAYNLGRLAAEAHRRNLPGPIDFAKAYGQMSLNPQLLGASRPQYSEPEEEHARGGALSRGR